MNTLNVAEHNYISWMNIHVGTLYVASYTVTLM